jgi:hypothetical protein
VLLNQHICVFFGCIQSLNENDARRFGSLLCLHLQMKRKCLPIGLDLFNGLYRIDTTSFFLKIMGERERGEDVLRNFLRFWPRHWTISKMCYGLDDRSSIPGRGNVGIFSFRHRIQTDSEAHPASYPMGTGDSYPGTKAAGAWGWPLTCIYCRG